MHNSAIPKKVLKTLLFGNLPGYEQCLVEMMRAPIAVKRPKFILLNTN